MQKKREYPSQNSQESDYDLDETINDDKCQECPVSRKSYEAFLIEKEGGGDGNKKPKRRQNCKSVQIKKRSRETEFKDTSDSTDEEDDIIPLVDDDENSNSSPDEEEDKDEDSQSASDKEEDSNLSSDKEEDPTLLPDKEAYSNFFPDNEECNLDDASAVKSAPNAGKSTIASSIRKRRILRDDEEENPFKEGLSTSAIAKNTAIIPIGSLTVGSSASKTDCLQKKRNIKNINEVTKHFMSKDKTKNTQPSRKTKQNNVCGSYLELEAEDKHKTLDEEHEWLDEADSEDEMFVENSDESSVEEGEIFTRTELRELQPHLWNNMQKIVLRGTPNEPPSTGYNKTIYFQSATTGSNWMFRMFENKLRSTFVHAFLLQSHVLPDQSLQDNTSKSERLDLNIILTEPIEELDKHSSLTIISFVMYTKACAEAFIEMIFNTYPRVSKLLFPTSHKGIETAIKKSIFSDMDGDYLIYRSETW